MEFYKPTKNSTVPTLIKIYMYIIKKTLLSSNPTQYAAEKFLALISLDIYQKS